MTDLAEQIRKAEVVVEALPYIRRFKGKTVVVKYGGSLMVDEGLKQEFASDIVLLKYVGINPIIVHGGGKEITKWLDKVGKKSVFIDGLRVTDSDTMEVTEMVLSGKINNEIVSMLNRAGGQAVGVSGKSANSFTARKIQGAKQEDLGLVGEIDTTDMSLVETLSSRGYIPVISSVAEDISGETLNINADYAASSVAVGLNALKLVYLTDVDGLMISGKLCSELDFVEAEKLLSNSEVKGGMLPKLKCSLAAIRGEVQHVHIINGGIKHAVLLELFTDFGIGTKISYSKRTA